MVWWIRVFGVFAPVAILILVTHSIPADSKGQPHPIEASFEPMAMVPVNDRLGIAFISSAEVARDYSGIPAYRYDRAASVGARWNRWPFYWTSIEVNKIDESGPYVADYTWQHSAVDSDYARGIQINGILLNTPSWATSASTAAREDAPQPRVGEGPRFMAPVAPNTAQTAISPASTTPRNLDLSVFSDGSDIPGHGKVINPYNYWARFVFHTVDRFKDKVKVWEIWNEPDHPLFWTGSVSDYARLLRVGYLAAKHADPSTTVLMGGMAYYSNTSFFEQLLGLIKSDYTASANNYYFDATAWHWYSRSSQMYDMVNYTKATLARYGLANKPIWVNETGVPIWDDPEKPPFGEPHPYYSGSATQDEAASYIIQAMAYGLAAGVERILHFQEYDDGNNEAFGLLSNSNRERPSFAAYRVASQHLQDYSDVQKATDGNVEKIIFSAYSQGKKVTVLWNKAPVDRNYTVTAMPGSTQAYLINKAGRVTNLGLTGSYPILLHGATNNNNHEGDPNDYIIGGSPYLLVEHFTPLTHRLRLPLIYRNGSAPQ